MAKAKAQSAVAFHYEHGAYSYDPQKETPAQGRRRCAKAAADAEAWLATIPHTVEWTEDEYADRSWLPNRDKRPLYCCDVIAYPTDDDKRESVSLCGIDLGPTGGECPEYQRVVVAQLAAELRGVLGQD